MSSLRSILGWGLESGVPAPDFSLVGTDNKNYMLSSFRGKKVFLYFYPQAFTTGCTAQACSFRDDYSLLRQHGYVLLGVSTDSLSVLQNFVDKFSIPYTMLSDESKKVCKDYEVLLPIGKANRVTFLINEQGIVEKSFRFLPWKSYARDLMKKSST